MLHSLHDQQRIHYKVALLTFKVRSTSTPSYLRRLIKDCEHSHNLRSTPRRYVNLSQRHLWNVLFDALHRQSGTHYGNLFSIVTLLQSKSRLKIFSFPTLSFLPLLTDMLSGLQRPEVRTLWHYTNMFIIIITITIIITIRSMVLVHYLVKKLQLWRCKSIAFIDARITS